MEKFGHALNEAEVAILHQIAFEKAALEKVFDVAFVRYVKAQMDLTVREQDMWNDLIATRGLQTGKIPFQTVVDEDGVIWVGRQP